MTEHLSLSKQQTAAIQDQISIRHLYFEIFFIWLPGVFELQYLAF